MSDNTDMSSEEFIMDKGRKTCILYGYGAICFSMIIFVIPVFNTGTPYLTDPVTILGFALVGLLMCVCLISCFMKKRFLLFCGRTSRLSDNSDTDSVESTYASIP